MRRPTLLALALVTAGAVLAASPAQADPPVLETFSGTWERLGEGYALDGVEADVGPPHYLDGTTAEADYDGDGTTEAIRAELDGLLGREVTVQAERGRRGDLDVFTIQGRRYRDPAGGPPPWAGGPRGPRPGGPPQEPGRPPGPPETGTARPGDEPVLETFSGTWERLGEGYALDGVEADVGPPHYLDGTTAEADYDGDGTTEAIRAELDGLLGREVTVQGERGRRGDLDVFTIQGLRYRDPAGGPPPWAGGPRGPRPGGLPQEPGRPPGPPETGTARAGDEPDAVQASVSLSRRSFPDAASARHAVLARDDEVADSLAGSALAGYSGPVLFTTGGPDQALRDETDRELRRVLVPGATVFVLGGQQAVSDQAVAEVTAAGFRVQRLAGVTRIETALAVAEVVDPAADRVLLARADGWADALTGGAYAASAGVPVLLTGSDALHPAVAAALAQSGARVVLLGGEAALSREVERAAGPGAVRIAGATRSGTAVEVARVLWGREAGGHGDGFVVEDGFGDGAWAPALAASVASARHGAPQLLVDGDAVPQETHRYLSSLGYGPDRAGWALLVGPLVGTEAERGVAALLGYY